MKAVGSRTMHTPYPFENLPRLTRRQVRALSRTRALFSDVAKDAALRTAESLLGTALKCSAGMPQPIEREQLAARGRAAWAELDYDDQRIWLELPSGVSEWLADRVLGGDATLGGVPSGLELDALSLGALAYVLARLCAAAGGEAQLRRISASAPQPSEAELVRLPIALQSGELNASVHLHLPAALRVRAGGARRVRRSVAEVQLVLWADAGRASFDLGTVRSIEVGDIVVLEHSDLVRAPTGQLAGKVRVRVEGSATAVQCKAVGDRLEVEKITCTEQPSMTQGRRMEETASETPALARDAPVEIALEVARFQIALGELERMAAGDVLLTGRQIGDHVTLRAAGQAFAEGELVDVEGELGVRVLRLIGK